MDSKTLHQNDPFQPKQCYLILPLKVGILYLVKFGKMVKVDDTKQVLVDCLRPI